LSTDGKTAHLIERAAARMVVPWGEVLARRAPTAEAVASPEAQRPPGIHSADLAAAEKATAVTISADALAKAGLINRTHRRSRIAEEFRIVQSKLLREAFGGNGVAATARGNLILVTSARQGEGKSFVAINMAAGIARQGDRRVLLVDADIKPGSLGHMLGVSSAPGLLDLVRSGGRNIEELIVPTAVDNLDLLPLGVGVEGSAELFASKRMAALIEDLGRRYADRPIIFDSSPCLSSSNPNALAPIVGQVIVVVAAGNTQQGEIETALELVQNCPRVSLLLNKIAPWNLHSFGSYSYPPPSA
jgi:protein-tyrosine kinase